ncbi:unnamed protein product [Callosobruchus maculatus]|uniref:Uncharacterized protein n=1 Tax=Callosobruchus maculatus TaxID=64391 RepID=A0A653BYM2_CALMS|nr:unnamed protein product [Callosobruchus maculatus]
MSSTCSFPSSWIKITSCTTITVIELYKEPWDVDLDIWKT